MNLLNLDLLAKLDNALSARDDAQKAYRRFLNSNDSIPASVMQKYEEAQEAAREEVKRLRRALKAA